MATEPVDFLIRTEDFAMQIIHLYLSLPKSNGVARVLGDQILRSGTSVGAHYAEANHSRSTADFASKIDCARQEVQETIYWLNLLRRSALIPLERAEELTNEAREIRAIPMAMSNNARKRPDRVSHS